MQADYKPITFIQTKHEFFLQRSESYLLEKIRRIWDAYDSIFDFAVNAGIKTSVELTQSIVGTKKDGIIGEKTLQKLNSLDFGYFQPAFTVTKITHYISIIKKRPTNKKYLYGWIIRALEYHS